MTEAAYQIAIEIMDEGGKTVASIVRIGRALERARALTWDEYRSVLDTAQVTDRQSRDQRGIARHPLLSDPAFFQQLPPFVSQLELLSRIPIAALLQALANGTIHPDLHLHDARELWQAWRASKPAPVAFVPGKRLYDTESRQARLDRIRELAEEGWTSTHIAASVGLKVEHTKNLMQEAGIDCPADRALGRRRRLDANRMLQGLVDIFDDIHADQASINLDALDPERLPLWIASLTASHRALGGFIARLRKGRTSDQQKVHTQAVEDPAVPDCQHADAASADFSTEVQAGVGRSDCGKS